MINLTPIAKPIQERMFEKMRVLGREKAPTNKEIKNVANPPLEMKDMATRTTFIRMTSGQEHPVVMMGGELGDDKEMVIGYDEIYGSRSGLDNKFKRPMPGIKSIDVQFKGGVRALRTANISWTCWTFEDLDRLRTHFLSHGKTVALEWGWVYNKDRFELLDTLIDSTGAIDPTGFLDYREKINKAQGDFDFMQGIVKNFEYTTRDDGGFDCKTDIVSTGVSILDVNTSSNASKLNLYGISEDDTVEEKIEKLQAIKKDRSELENIAFNSKLSLGIFMERFDNWLNPLTIGELEPPSEQSGDVPPPLSSTAGFGTPPRTAEMEAGGIYWEYNNGQLGGGQARNVTYYYFDADRNLIEPGPHVPGSRKALQATDFLASQGPQDDIIGGNYDFEPNCYILQNAGRVNMSRTSWVRWGWFEDNILNKFVAFISPKAKEEGARIINEMRSVNRIINIDEDGNPIITNAFVSTLIRNHELLETTDIMKFILPGQFTAHEEDSISLKSLVNIVDNTDNFNQFKNPDNSAQGFFRNILFNTKFLAECFSFTGNNDLQTGLENLFNGMNGDINFWLLTTETDAIETNRLKIIDEYSTYYEWMRPTKKGKPFSPLEKKTILNDNGEIDGKVGVFHFPVWKHNSIVKRQSLTAKVPKAMQMAAMYGANLDTMTNLMGTDENLSIQGQAAGATGKDAIDVYKKGVDLAFKFEYTTDGEISIGKPRGSETGPLSLKEGTRLGLGDPTSHSYFIDELEGFLSNEIVDQVAEFSNVRIPELGEDEYDELMAYTMDPTPSDEAKLDYIEEQVIERKEAEGLKWWYPSKWIKAFRKKREEDKVAYSGMLPTDQAFTDPEHFKKFENNLQQLVKYGQYRIGGKVVKIKNPEEGAAKLRAALNVLNKKYKLNGKMRNNFRDRIAKFVTIYGSARTSTLPILIPLELELEIDGIGGIYPGNSFHSDYVPERYKTETMFQCFDVNHTVDSSGWSVTLTGKMRASIAGLYDTVYTTEEKVGEAVKDVYTELTVPVYEKKD
jgi:hypothetical protein